MPFAVFRRHQRKLLAVIALLAMGSFVLSDSGALFRGRGDSTPGGPDPVVVRLYNRPVPRSDLLEIQAQRVRANQFMARLGALTRNPQATDRFFGDLNDRALVDALIQRHEADTLGLPGGADLARQWLRRNYQMTTDLFDRIYREGFSDRVTDTQLLADLGDQLRLMYVGSLPGLPEITPLEVFDAYRDQYEQVSAQVVAFPVADYLSKVKDPSDDEVRSFYDRYKAVSPDPDRPTPGFLVPRKVQVEFVMADASALAAAIRPKLTEAELREAYAARKEEFDDPDRLPTNLFAGDPDAKLTPALGDPFRAAREKVAEALAEERAREEIDRMFGAVRDVMVRFGDSYAEAEEATKEALSAGKKAVATLPTPKDLIAPVAAREGLKREVTPLMSREDAERHAPIAGAKAGTGGPSGGGRTFTEEMFDPKEPVYDPSEFADARGLRFLAWKLADLPARVPPLDEARTEVVRAWKLEKARPLAEADAKALRDRALQAGADLKKVAGSKLVVTTDPVPRVQGNPLNPFAEPRHSDIPQLPRAGDALRDAYFGLGAKDVAVAPDAPKTTYYVLALDRRIAANFGDLYSTFGPYRSIQQEVLLKAARERGRRWMDQLRTRAGLLPTWVPPDEARGAAVASAE